jgi:heavy metal translocating P-type ATPase
LNNVNSASIQTETKLQCCHCELPVLTPYFDEEEKIFCCRGCLSVYRILKNNGLQNFYSIQNSEDRPKKAVKQKAKRGFSFLNDSAFLENYIHINSNSQVSLSFYLEGIHCLACLWLIEKAPSFASEVATARLNFESSVVKITLKRGHHGFSNIASTFNDLGYAPTPLRNDDEVKALQKKEERGYLLKMGVAAACMMNIMLYTIGLYAGAQGLIGSAFSYISLIFCIPVVLYSAKPFYTSSISALKKKSINIDTPLSIAISLGFLVSVYNVITGSSVHYFDSIATLTFLILFSRYLLLKASRYTFSKTDINSFLSDSTVLRRNTLGELEDIHHSQILVGDTILVAPGASIPCDGEIIKGSSKISLAILNGESKPLEHKEGMTVFMGTTNLGTMIEIKANACGESTRLGQIYALAQENEKEKSTITLLSDKISKFFVASVLSLALVTVLYFALGNSGLLETGINRALALIIITCPCALGLATPLTYSRLINLSSKLGALVKSEYVLEKLSLAQNIFFDKTGTLTKGDYHVASYNQHLALKTPFSVADIVFSMEANSNHPVALSLIQWSKDFSKTLKVVPFSSQLEILGKGVQASLDGILYEIRSQASDEEFLRIGLFENHKLIAEFFLKDQIKESAQELLNNLKNQNYNLYLASGDQAAQVEEVSQALGFKKDSSRSNMSPEEKGQWVDKFPNTLFIGDGVNDTVAFSKSNTSIAVKGSLEVALNSSEVFLKNCDIELVAPLLQMAKAGTKTVRRNLAFSIFYNITGASLAITGLLGPLEAAILMPLSSLTVLISSLWGTRQSLFFKNEEK